MQQMSDTASLSLVIEPEQLSVCTVVDAIKATQSTLQVEVYEVNSPDILDALAEVKNRGNTHIQVLIDKSVDFQGKFLAGLTALAQAQTPAATSSTYTAQYSQARLPNGYPVKFTHAKFMIIDDKVAYIMTTNFSEAALGLGLRGTFPARLATNREYILIDRDPQDIATLKTIFQADQSGTALTFTPTIPTRLVVSPFNARAALYNLITSAAPHSLLQLESEELQDPPTDLYGKAAPQSIEQALVDAVKRGVTVQLILPIVPPNLQGNFPPGEDANSPGVKFVTAGGVKVYRDPNLYMHAKLIIAGNTAFIGSQNLSWVSLDKNREVGLMVSDPTILAQLRTTFQQDLTASGPSVGA